MGAARNNPLSPQFRGTYPTEILSCGTMVYEGPSDEWKAAHPGCDPDGATADGETPGPEEVVVSVMLTIKRTEPSALFPGDPYKWPSSEVVALGPVLFLQGDQAIPAVMTLANWRKLTPTSKAAPDPTIEDELDTDPPALEEKPS